MKHTRWQQLPVGHVHTRSAPSTKLLNCIMDSGQGRMHKMAHQWRCSENCSALATCQCSDDLEVKEGGEGSPDPGWGDPLPHRFGF